MTTVGYDNTIAYFIIGSPKEGYLSRVGKVKPTLLTFPPISLPPSGLQVDPREASGDRNNDTSGWKLNKKGGSFFSGQKATPSIFQSDSIPSRMKSYR